MSQRNLAIKGSTEIDGEFLRHFIPLECYQTANLRIDNSVEKKFERIIEKEANRIRADLAVITAINESRITETSNKEIIFYQKIYHSRNRQRTYNHYNNIYKFR